MKTSLAGITAGMVLGLLSAAPAYADSVILDPAHARIVLDDREQRLIRDYYRGMQAAPGKPLNKGMQKRLEKGKGLPPGWQKKMTRGRPIPADIWAYHEPLPYDILRRLPPQPDGVATVRIDNEIVRVVTATQVLLDIFGLY